MSVDNNNSEPEKPAESMEPPDSADERAALDRIRERRALRADALLGMRADEAQALLGEEVRVLEERLQIFEESGTREEGLAIELLQLGEKVRWCVWMGDALAGERKRDPLGVIEGELGWAVQQAKRLRRWDTSYRERAESLGQRVEYVRDSILRLKEERFLGAPTEDPAVPRLERALSAWFAADEGFQLEAQAASSPRGGEASSLVDDIRELRQAHLDRCRELVAELAEASLLQFVRIVSAELADRASAVLSEAAAAAVRTPIPVLDALRQGCEAFHSVLGTRLETLSQCPGLDESDRREIREALRAVSRIRKRSLVAKHEEDTQQRLEGFFGRKNVKRFENFILVLILVFIALFIIEWNLDDGFSPGESAADGATESPTGPREMPRWLWYIHLADGFLCIFFQLDFFVRWGFARWRWSYFVRHFWFESLPAIPYGLLAPTLGLELMIVLRVQRFLRIFRAVIFLFRGSDRAVEKFRPILDQDVVVFDPTPAGDTPESPLQQRLRALQSNHLKILRDLYAEIAWPDRAAFLTDYVRALELEASVCSNQKLPYRSRAADAHREIRLEWVIDRLLDCDVARTISVLGRDGSERLARSLRFFDLPLLRRLPIVRRIVPAARRASPTEAASAAAQAVGQVLQDALGVLRFFGDLSGITTGPQILDRIASAVILAAKRPAVRLLLLGAVFLVIQALAGWLPGDGWVSTAIEKVSTLLGYPIIILGSVCLVALAFGWWFKRIAGEALDVFLRTADAHHHQLLKNWKASRIEQDVQALNRSVLQPEIQLRGDRAIDDETACHFLTDPLRRGALQLAVPAPTDDRLEEFGSDLESIIMLYRDFLDGPILHRQDDKTSVQLLGNLVVHDIRSRTLGLSRREMRQLEKLDLEKKKLLSFGPYFWFRYITESLAIETAKLVTEYNICCVPLDRLQHVAPDVRQRFERFIDERRSDSDPDRGDRQRSMAFMREPLINDDFSVLNFLTADRELDERVRRRYGDEVLNAMRQDRRGVVRDIFGTRPYHLLPRAERTLNPYRFYRRYLGARVVLLPVLALVAVFRFTLLGMRQMFRLVEEVLGRKRVLRSQLSRSAGFEVATRKINRMRKPFFMEALRLRAAMDIEYLGLRIPGVEADSEDTAYRADLEFIGATRSERRPVLEFRERAVTDLRRFRSFLVDEWGIEDNYRNLFCTLDETGELEASRGEVLRALVTAYITDHQGLRTLVVAEDESSRFVEESLERRETRTFRVGMFLGSWLLFALPAVRRRRTLFGQFIHDSTDYSRLNRAARKKLWRSFVTAPAAIENAVRLSLERRQHAAEGRDAVLEKLRRVAWSHASWTQRIVTVRTLQVITVLDIRAYRDLIYEVGGYADEERRPVSRRA